ncbi:MAG: hypothetical protein ACOYMA_04390 [Bacteroidia bacterium]
MINNHLENPFENSRAAHEDFGFLVQSHINFLKAQNTSGTYTAMINLVETPYAIYRKWIGDQETTLTTKKGKTITVNSVLNEFDGFVDNLYDEVFKWKRQKPEAYNALFPKGKDEYSKITKTDAQTIMQRLSDACNKNVDLDKTFKDKALELLNEFISVRDAQLGKKGEVKDGSSEGNTLRLAVATSMYLVLLDLIKLNINDRNKVKDFYDAQFINPKTTPKKTTPKPPKV